MLCKISTEKSSFMYINFLRKNPQKIYKYHTYCADNYYSVPNPFIYRKKLAVKCEKQKQ